MASPDFRGARGSNTGDSFHELWALHQSLRLLDVRSPLTALTVEGVIEEEPGDGRADQWEGVDCGLYYGGGAIETAASVELVQLKYSGANPDSPWTVANLTENTGKKTKHSVIRRLAAAFASALNKRPRHKLNTLTVKLVSNRPVAPEVLDSFEFGKKALTSTKGKKRRNGTQSDNWARLQQASGLDTNEFQNFCRALSFEGRSGSRFALHEQLIRSISSWIGDDARTQVNNLLQFVRNRMMPEETGRPINCESILEPVS